MHTISYINKFYFYAKWCLKFFLQTVGVRFVSPSLELHEGGSFLSSKGGLLAGWYMLEVKITSVTTRFTGQAYLYGRSYENDIQPLNLTLYSGQISKRLVYSSADGEKFRFNLDLEQGTFEVQHFSLAMVSKKFARSRILTKLQALHPRYIERSDNYLYPSDAHTINTTDLPTLWIDYCALFDKSVELVSYSSWLKAFDFFPDDLRTIIRKHHAGFKHKPLISIVMPIHSPNPAWFQDSIESVKKQVYQNWELCIADDASSDPTVRLILEQYASSDQRIKVVFRENNGHISAASNSALGLAQADWVALLDHDDVLAEHALFWVVDAINRHPACRLIYSDEDKIDEAVVRSDPYFKPEWNQDLFYSQNMFSHLGVYHADLVRAVGGFRVGYEGSQDYDLALRCIVRIKPSQIHHIPRVLYHWRMHAQSTAQSINAKPYAMLAGARALNDHFSRTGVDALAESVGYGYRVRYALPAVLPLVSLIIPTRNGLKLLRQCVQSILNKTTYANFEILIVDNGSNDAATLRYLKGLSADNRIRVLRDDRPFNYSQLNNTAVLQARGDVLGLVNNDIEVISPDWLTEMVSHAVRPGVGAVGARLWYADNTLQHAGVVLGLEGFAGHVHRYLPRGNVGYCGRAALTQSFSAVTGACLVVKKSSYLQVGGLNEVDLPVACNDIDFCLKLLKAGYRNLWTPWAELYHHESSTRGFDDTPEKLARSKKEVAYMWQHWGDMLRNDPAYSPNLTLDASDFGLAWPPRLAPNV